MSHFQGTESEVWYEEVGLANGPPLVWVGGGGTMGRDWHRFQTPHFANRYRNLVFDNRGIGHGPRLLYGRAHEEINQVIEGIVGEME